MQWGVLLAAVWLCLAALSHGAGPPLPPAPTATLSGRLEEKDSRTGAYALAFSPDGRALAVAAFNSYLPGVTLWEVATLRPRAVSTAGRPPETPMALVFLQGGRRLFAGADKPLVCELPSF